MLWLARWPSFPLVLDPAYHLLMARQVVAANGPILYDWWEYAPLGRPHLYPPILHVVLAGLLKGGISPVTTIRLASVVLFPSLLVSIWLVVHRLLRPSTALCCVWMSLLPWVFYLHTTMAMAATLGMIELLWMIERLEARRPVAAGILFALLCYTHLGLPWIALVAVGCYGVLQPAARPILLRASWGLVPVLPWWWHLWNHRALLHTVSRSENLMFELLPCVIVTAVIGAWRCWRLKGTYLWCLALWAGFTLLLPSYFYRWINGEGVLPLILLGGVALEWMIGIVTTGIEGRLGALTAHRGGAAALATLVVMITCVLSPTFVSHAGHGRWLWPDSGLLHVMGAPGMTERRLEIGVHGPLIEQVVQEVEHLTTPGEILWSNAPYAVGWVAALSQRAMSSSMLDEVPAEHTTDPIDAAHLIVWFKMLPMPGDPGPEILKGHPIERVAEQELAIFLRNPRARQRAATPKAIIPLWAAMACVLGALGLIVGEARRFPRQAYLRRGRGRQAGEKPV